MSSVVWTWIESKIKSTIDWVLIRCYCLRLGVIWGVIQSSISFISGWTSNKSIKFWPKGNILTKTPTRTIPHRSNPLPRLICIAPWLFSSSNYRSIIIRQAEKRPAISIEKIERKHNGRGLNGREKKRKKKLFSLYLHRNRVVPMAEWLSDWMSSSEFGRIIPWILNPKSVHRWHPLAIQHKDTRSHSQPPQPVRIE